MAEFENINELEFNQIKKFSDKQNRITNFLQRFYGEDATNLYKSIIILFDKKFYKSDEMIIAHLLNELFNIVFKQEGLELIEDLQDKFEDIKACKMLYDDKLDILERKEEFEKNSSPINIHISETNKIYYILVKYFGKPDEDDKKYDDQLKEIKNAKSNLCKFRHIHDIKLYYNNEEFNKIYGICENFLYKLSQSPIGKEFYDSDKLLSLSKD